MTEEDINAYKVCAHLIDARRCLRKAKQANTDESLRVEIESDLLEVEDTLEEILGEDWDAE
jgi:flagellar motility protein MotE (MotC chaperone)